MDDDTVMELVGELYSAAYDRSRWPDYLERLRLRTGSATAYLVVVDPTGAQPGVIEGPLASSTFNRQYQDHYYKADLWADAYARHGPGPGRVWGSHQLVPDAVMAASEWYNDLLRLFDCFYSFGGFMLQDGPASTGFGVLRSRRQGPADAAAMRLLSALMPHQQQALRIDARLRQLEALRGVSGAVIDALPYGLVVLDRGRRILAMNRIAETIVVAGAGLRFGSGGIAGLRPAEEARLQAAIAGATATAPSTSTLLLSRPDHSQPLRVIVAPVPREVPIVPLVHPMPAALLFLHDPASRAEPAPALLGRLYGLTARESTLAAALARGASLSETAAAMGIARKTAGSHLRQIFRKTGARRQAELVAMLASAPAVGGLDSTDD